MGGLIDFKQVATQIVGFLIFLWLIRKYAWGPVLETLEQRRAKIVGDLAHAEKEMQDAAALATVRGHMKADCWRKWRGDDYGNKGRMTIRWADENVDAWLKKLNPEAAVLLLVPGCTDAEPRPAAGQPSTV